MIETRQPGQGATRASAGILAPYIEGHESAVLRGLGRRSLDLFDAFITGLRAASGHDVVYQRNGTFELAFDQADVDRLTGLSAALSAGGVDHQWVPPQAFADYEPLASSVARGALFIAPHGFVGVTSVTLAAADAAQQLGASITTETGAIRIHSLAAGRVGVETAGVSWDADRVVLAAGSWSSRRSRTSAAPCRSWR